LQLFGYPPTLIDSGEGDVTRAPDEDALVIAGKIPTLFREDTVAPAIDDLVLAGKIPVVWQTWSAAPAEDDLVIAGKIPTAFREDTVAPAIDDLVLAGKIPVMMQTHSAAPAEDDLVLAGKIPDVLSGQVFVPAIDDLVLAGKIPVMMQTHSAAPAEDDLVLAGKIPLANVEHFAAPAEVDLVLAGKIPEVPSSDSIEVPPGFLRVFSVRGLQLRGATPTVIVSSAAARTPAEVDLVLAGQAPTVRQTWSAAPAEDDLALAGKIPTVRQTQRATPAERDLVLAGKIPVIRQTWSAAPAAETLVLGGKVPVIPATGDSVTPPTLELNLVPFDGLELFGHPPTPTRTGTYTRSDAATLAIRGYTFVAIDSEDNHAIVVPEATLDFLSYVPIRPHGLLLHGHAPNLVGDNPEPLTAALTLSGLAPSAVNTTPLQQTAAPGVRRAILDTFAPSLAMGQETEDVSVILEGWAPVASATSPVFFPGEAALSFTGQVAEIPENKRAFPAIDSLLLAGQLPLALRGSFITPLVGAAVLAGKAPVVFSTPRALPAAASLTLTPELVYIGRSIWSAAVARELTGYAPTFVNTDLSKSAAPAEVDLSLTGHVPIVARGTPIRLPAVAALALSGKTPVVGHETDSTRVPRAATPVLSTHAPTLLTKGVKIPAAETLVLSGQAPTLRTKRIRKAGARTRLISLTTRYDLIHGKKLRRYPPYPYVLIQSSTPQTLATYVDTQYLITISGTFAESGAYYFAGDKYVYNVTQQLGPQLVISKPASSGWVLFHEAFDNGATWLENDEWELWQLKS